MTESKYPNWHSLSKARLSSEQVFQQAEREGWSAVAQQLDANFDESDPRTRTWWVIAQVLGGSLPPAAAFGTLDKVFQSGDWEKNNDLSLCAATLLAEALENTNQSRLSEIAWSYAERSGGEKPAAPPVSEDVTNEEPEQISIKENASTESKNRFLVPALLLSLAAAALLLYTNNTEERIYQTKNPQEQTESELIKVLERPLEPKIEPIEINERLKEMNEKLKSETEEQPSSLVYESPEEKERKRKEKNKLPSLEAAELDGSSPVELKGSGTGTEILDLNARTTRNIIKDHESKDWLGERYEALVPTVVRERASLRGTVRARLNAGDSVEVTNRLGIWLELRSKGGNSGYALAQDFKKVGGTR